MNSAGQADEERGRREGAHCGNNLRGPGGKTEAEGGMPQPTPEEKAILAEAPRGAFALMILVAALLLAGWAVLYVVGFLSNGPIR